MSNIIIPGSPIGDQQLATYEQATAGWMPVQIGDLPYKINVGAFAKARTKAYLITKSRGSYEDSSNAWGVVGYRMSDCNATTSSPIPVPNGDILSNGISVVNGHAKFPHNGIYQINITVPMEITSVGTNRDIGRLIISSAVYCPKTHNQYTGGGMQTVLDVNRKVKATHFMHLNYIAAVMDYSDAVLDTQAYCVGLNLPQGEEDAYEVRVHNPEVYIAEVC